MDERRNEESSNGQLREAWFRRRGSANSPIAPSTCRGPENSERPHTRRCDALRPRRRSRRETCEQGHDGNRQELPDTSRDVFEWTGSSLQGNEGIPDPARGSAIHTRQRHRRYPAWPLGESEALYSLDSRIDLLTSDHGVADSGCRAYSWRRRASSALCHSGTGKSSPCVWTILSQRSSTN